MMVRSILILVAALTSPLALACPACDDSKAATISESQKISELTPAQLREMVSAKRVHIFDANPRDIFEKNHVPAAVHVEYDQVTQTVLPEDKSAAVVFYCMNERCGASPVAARRASELGWRNVYLMPAGIQGWIAAGLPVETASSAI